MHRNHHQLSRRGTAEIETLLVIPILLFLLTMVGAAAKLGMARLYNVYAANDKTFTDATVSENPQYTPSAELSPTSSLTDVTSGLNPLPNRFHVATNETTANMTLLGFPSFKTTLSDKAAYTSPSWAYSGYPVESDANATSEWFTEYSGQLRDQVKDPLELSNASPP